MDNYSIGSPNTYTGEIAHSYYGYNVQKGTAIFFVAAFGLSFMLHVFQTIKSRRWWLILLCVGVLGEITGWAARLASALSTTWSPALGGFWLSNDTAFLAQISTLIFSPAFLQAANYIILAWITMLLGSQFLRIHPVTYSVVFCIGDLISLVVQAVGGGMASSADTLAGANQGAYVMVGGVFAQMVVMLLFTALLVEYCVRYSRNRPVTRIRPFAFLVNNCCSRRRKDSDIGLTAQSDQIVLSPAEIKRIKLQLAGISGSTLLIFIRSIYRCVELLDGWTGPIITNQNLFNGLDGAMMLASCLLINVLHPMFLLRPLGRPTPVDDSRVANLEKRDVEVALPSQQQL